MQRTLWITGVEEQTEWALQGQSKAEFICKFRPCSIYRTPLVMPYFHWLQSSGTLHSCPCGGEYHRSQSRGRLYQSRMAQEPDQLSLAPTHIGYCFQDNAGNFTDLDCHLKLCSRLLLRPIFTIQPACNLGTRASWTACNQLTLGWPHLLLRNCVILHQARQLWLSQHWSACSTCPIRRTLLTIPHYCCRARPSWRLSYQHCSLANRFFA